VCNIHSASRRLILRIRIMNDEGGAKGDDSGSPEDDGAW
jgi:hypothetical protein